MSDATASKRQELNKLSAKVRTATEFGALIDDPIVVVRLSGRHSDEEYRSLASELMHEDPTYEVLYGPQSGAFVIIAIERLHQVPVASLAAARVALGR